MASSPNRRPSGRTTPRKQATSLRRVLDAATQTEASKQELVMAPNWRTPIYVDLVLGTVVFVVGLVLAIAWSPIAGGGIGALGALYDALAIRRWRRWAALRRDLRGSD
jgi:hypothetical protein